MLPFENLSDDKSNAYFAEGIQDEILTRLSKIADLKVISRTSTQKYKSAPDNLREIGQQLGVANVIEGSVQKIANAVHVNVQLIRAATDEHVWAESYNRKLDDVFAVEGEVASAIAEQLSLKLSGTEQKAVTAKPTENAAAYDAFLRGLSIEHTSYGYDTYQRAALSYAKAVELDPNFALAWARLSILRSFLYFNTIDPKTNSADAVKTAADHAMSLAPDLGEAHVAQGSYRYRVLRDFEGALSSYKKAQQLLPNSALVNEYIAYVLRRLGRWEEAEPYYRKAIELDPLDVQLLSSFGAEYYFYLRRFKEAYVGLDRAIQIAPDADNARAVKAGVLMSEGRLAEADQELAKIPANAFDDFIVNNRLNQFLYERKFKEATDFMQRRIQALPANEPADAWVRLFMVQAAFCHEWLGQKEEARQLFERVVQETKPTPDTIVKPEANGLPSTLALAYAGLGEKEKALQQASSGSERLRNRRREQTGCGNRSRANPGALRPDRRCHRGLTASSASSRRPHRRELKLRSDVGPDPQRSAFSKTLRTSLIQVSEKLLLCRAEAAQRLQGRCRVRGRRLAARPSCYAGFSVFRNSELGGATSLCSQS